MKTDLTHLSLENQIAAVADRLRALVKCGLTDTPDLQRYFKHRAFKQPALRAWHFTRLMTAALFLLNGRKAEFEKILTDMKAQAVIFEPGDFVLYDGERCLVKDILPEAKLFVSTPTGNRTVSAHACAPILHVNTP